MRNRFDRQLLRLNQEMIDMGSLCEEMITAAAKIVATRDKELMDDIVTMEEALNKYEAITVHGKYVKLLVNGVRVADSRFTKDKVINNTLYRVYDENNNFIGLGERNDAGFKIEKLLIT